MKKISYTLAEIDAVARQLLDEVPDKTLLFHGVMGAGKTTLIKSLAQQLGVRDMTSSPTFGLVNEYVGDNGCAVYHFDFYRIKDETEALDIGIEDYLYADTWIFVEWPEKIEGLLPEEAVHIYITEQPDGNRELSF
ncbi:tRNA (adenosine(37)-N6)-threonylcarbamoyltransferase complex ATPase subunit type 1 TsaE [Sinomicrobium weinanense]|uniref:tRNA threonylcarbamoyladenosine biosynthesis protein TsaE n=1 Tax=Sinomicrobium weinanense TaxID=2842200 RepID=A0A926JQA4_9FLAO|nr:tRNA (adenosine(37)-N6)-threonylcarbamoyltransferase complex ATPase subunit type 1 TsaE [Sinomicrobium weinanense]MBC9795327.1 tRNA (adenosine(37)-N6)-threonylcarbamoyltransferase complex ATPase subunit type 1 TsaE [Sinomicrobium weinanense]MBU3122958.1 tRNA (adenosine(37)-N6)-threonylcarbamoyltransferase complex ATPase subunit type 1 TsaE [Sinomicrobium weinanense]